MLGHRKSRSVLAYASQMLTKSTSEASPGFTDVEMGASAAGYAILGKPITYSPSDIAE